MTIVTKGDLSMNYGEGSCYDVVQKFLKLANFTENLVLNHQY